MDMKLWAASQTGKPKTELDWQNRNIKPLSEAGAFGNIDQQTKDLINKKKRKLVSRENQDPTKLQPEEAAVRALVPSSDKSNTNVSKPGITDPETGTNTPPVKEKYSSSQGKEGPYYQIMPDTVVNPQKGVFVGTQWSGVQSENGQESGRSGTSSFIPAMGTTTPPPSMRKSKPASVQETYIKMICQSVLSETVFSDKDPYAGFPELGEWHKGNDALTKQNIEAIRGAATPEELKILDWTPDPMSHNISGIMRQEKQRDEIYKKYSGQLKLPGQYSSGIGRPGWTNPQSDAVKQQQNAWSRQQATRM